ncbi:MAG: hypothetical protein M3Z24_06425 [Chloroflexota bacterium]|nr:hypothetical protein [Chloroflexota bacterium]
MNINTGVPHILLFERDQQLAALLTTELQAVGYECHTARTAVEVFDAIARYSVKLVLVNLAQAAAARREFWVALDTQRRGRGVQVFTFHCANIAGYGPLDDPDDRSNTMLADMEIDGMQGVMNMVNAVRSRIAVSNTGAMARLNSNFSVQNEARQSSQYDRNRVTGQQSFQSNNSSSGLPPTTSPTSPTSPSPAYSQQPSPLEMPRTPIINHTDKIRAVIHPSQRMTSSWNTPRENAVVDNGQGTAGARNQQPAPPNISWPQPTQPTQLTQLNQQAQPEFLESGLAQLSRMVQKDQEHHFSSEPVQAVPPVQHPGLPQYSQEEGWQPLELSRGNANGSAIQSLLETTLPQQSVRSTTPSSSGASPMRAAPIQDMPTDRMSTAFQSDVRRLDTNTSPSQTSSTLMSLAQSAPTPPQDKVTSIQTPEPIEYSPIAPSYQSTPTSSTQPLTEETEQEAETERERKLIEQIQAIVQEQEDIQQRVSILTQEKEKAQRKAEALAREQEEARQRAVALAEQRQIQEQAEALRRALDQEEARQRAVELEEAEAEQKEQARRDAVERNESIENTTSRALREIMLEQAQKGIESDHKVATDSALLLDIVQSLPLMPPTPPQPQVLTGRATRSLGNVLLEGHLIPQNRLEVALAVQRMLSGVDLNYQLGEILLMFKLLTPDQLLAASLVSYGMITTSQISALGRIRQELHAIGLEYDLENLLILFRILTSEQLREVRASWSG